MKELSRKLTESERKLSDSEQRQRGLEDILENERNTLKDVSLHEHTALNEVEQLLQVEMERRTTMEGRLKQIIEEKEKVCYYYY